MAVATVNLRITRVDGFLGAVEPVVARSVARWALELSKDWVWTGRCLLSQVWQSFESMSGVGLMMQWVSELCVASVIIVVCAVCS